MNWFSKIIVFFKFWHAFKNQSFLIQKSFRRLYNVCRFYWLVKVQYSDYIVGKFCSRCGFGFVSHLGRTIAVIQVNHRNHRKQERLSTHFTAHRTDLRCFRVINPNNKNSKSTVDDCRLTKVISTPNLTPLDKYQLLQTISTCKIAWNLLETSQFEYQLSMTHKNIIYPTRNSRQTVPSIAPAH